MRAEASISYLYTICCFLYHSDGMSHFAQSIFLKMADMGEVIDVDSYAGDKAAGKMKQESEVINLDTYAIQDMTAVDMSLNLNLRPETVDEDSYVNIAAVEGK